MRNLDALIHAVEKDLKANQLRIEIFKAKLKPKLKKGGMIRRRCYSLKRTSVTAIISENLS